MELRETQSSLYTVRDTPIFTCIRGENMRAASPGGVPVPVLADGGDADAVRGELLRDGRQHTGPVRDVQAHVVARLRPAADVATKRDRHAEDT